jgi:hypothetical protein
MLSENKPVEFGTAALLFWPAVLLPRAFQCLFAPRGPDRPGLHVVLHLLGPMIAGTLAAFSFALGAALFVPAAVFPSSLWWLVVTDAYRLESHVLTIAIIGALWVVGLTVVFFLHSRGYWRALATQAATARDARRPGPLVRAADAHKGTDPRSGPTDPPS